MTQILTMLTVRHSPGTVAGALDSAGDQGEGVALQDGVDCLERGVGHLHPALHPPHLVQEVVAERGVETQVPEHTGQQSRVSSVISQHDLTINAANWRRTMTSLSLVIDLSSEMLKNLRRNK